MLTLTRWLESVRGAFPIGARIVLGAALVLGAARPVSAQAKTGTLVVTVRRADSTPIFGAFVRSVRTGAVTDANGVARLALPAALATVVVTSPGFRPKQFEITILAGVSQRFELGLEREVGGPRVARTGRLDGSRDDSPLPIKALGAAELDQRTQGHPTDLTRTSGFDWGLRTQPQVGPLDGARLRLDGLRGQYTGILIDGLPLAGGYPGAFGALHLSPFEFSEVELVPGAAGAWYGPQAAGGVLNLISRRPDRDQARLGINQSSEKGGDVMFFGGRRQSPTLGATLTADFHQQRLVDSDDDGWGEFPRAVRFSVRPRVFIDRPNGDAIMATLGAMTEERTGGYLSTSTNPDLYRETRQSSQVDGAVAVTKNLDGRAVLRFTVATVFQANSHRFEDRRERDRRTTLTADLSVTKPIGSASVAVGIGYQRDGFTQQTFPDFGLIQSVPSVFAEGRFPLADRVTAAVAGRCDQHNLHGLQCVPRIDLLFRASAAVQLRAYGGLSYTSPISLTDDVETIGLSTLLPAALKAERLATAGFDLRVRYRAWDFGLVSSYGRVGYPIRLVPLTGNIVQRLLNLSEPTRAVTATASVGYRWGSTTLRGFYRWQDATEGVPGGTGRREADLTPHHQLGAELAWQAPASGTEAKLEWYYVGAQALTDDPFRTRAPAYPIAHALISQRSGRARIFLSAENLLDRKLRQYEPVVFAAPVFGRLTSSPWIPVRGREISLGALVDW